MRCQTALWTEKISIDLSNFANHFAYLEQGTILLHVLCLALLLFTRVLVFRIIYNEVILLGILPLLFVASLEFLVLGPFGGKRPVAGEHKVVLCEGLGGVSALRFARTVIDQNLEVAVGLAFNLAFPLV